MIIGHETGDITSPNNRRDIIIGMNTNLGDVKGIGLHFARNLKLTHPLTLGGVLSFKYDEGRHLHMLVCHELGGGGWKNAERYVRFGLDYLWHSEIVEKFTTREFSIVEIGTGRVGMRDGANAPLIHQAMTFSHLELTLFVNFNNVGRVAGADAIVVPLRAYRAWTPQHGEERLVA